MGDDYLFGDADTSVIKNLSKMGSHLKELQAKMIEAEEEAAQAKKAYEYYASNILPMEMFNAGVSELKLVTGETIKYERKYYCSPNKNDEDKAFIAEWLRDNGGEVLVKEKIIVPANEADTLQEEGIPYVMMYDINSSSLKAFIKDKIGANDGSTAVMQITDIPDCIHFQEVGQVVIG